MTYSIVARDPASGRFGVAIQTAWPFVGSTCPWVESGVGAVSTQSFTEIAHGPNGLALLRSGGAATEALAALLETDPGRAVRQVGIVDADGGAASWTGESCVASAGHVTADGVAIQANMMERPIGLAGDARSVACAGRLVRRPAPRGAPGGGAGGRRHPRPAVGRDRGLGHARGARLDAPVRRPGRRSSARRSTSSNGSSGCISGSTRSIERRRWAGAATAKARDAPAKRPRGSRPATARSSSGGRSGWRWAGCSSRRRRCSPRRRARTRAGRSSSAGWPRAARSRRSPTGRGPSSETDAGAAGGSCRRCR